MFNWIWLFWWLILDYWVVMDEMFGDVVVYVLIYEIGYYFGLSD